MCASPWDKSSHGRPRADDPPPRQILDGIHGLLRTGRAVA
jgi:hypothetical protein